MTRSKTGLLIAVAVLAVAAAFAAPVRRAPVTSYGPALIPGDKVPTVSGTALDGKETTVSYAAAKLTLVNFWATWCVPCRQEMPILEKLRAAHADGGLQVVGALLYEETTPEQVETAVKDAGAKYTIVAVPPGTTHAWGGLTLVPTTFLVDREGKLVRKFVGTDEEGTKVLARDIADFLAGRPLGNPYLPPSVK